MKLNEIQKEEVKKAINKTIEEMFESEYFLRRVRKGIFLALEKGVTKASKLTEEEKAIEKYVKISKPEDEVWMDLTSAALQSLLVMSFPELQKRISTIKIGKALSKAGALKSMKNGINVYRINKVKTKKKD